FRTLGTGVNIELAGNSFVGQNAFTDGPNGTDNGRTADQSTGVGSDVNNSSDLTGTARGAILEIKGNITESGGSRSLTKQSTDTVILSGNNTYSGGTSIANGTLRLGSNTAMAQSGDLTTSSRGVLDMAGYNASVKHLSAVSTSSTSTFASSSGFITNSSTAAAPSVLSVGTGSTADYTYGGVIQNNVAITKEGTHKLTLTNVNTYRGNTLINAGTVALTGTATINDSPWIQVGPGSGAGLDVSGRTAPTAGSYTYDGTVSGGGVGTLKTDNTNRGIITGSLVIGDAVGEVCLIGTMSPGGSSLNTLATAGDQVGHINVTSNLTLSGAITGTSPAVSTTRLTMQANTPTTSLFDLGWDGVSNMFTFIDGLPTGTTTQQNALNGLFGNLSGHDYVNVGGTFTVNPQGTINVTSTGVPTFQGGEFFNLIDWVGLASGFGATYGTNFVVGSRFQLGAEPLSAQDLDLPDLTSTGLQWDTSLFATYGVVIVVPEPSRLMLVFFGIFGLFFRRRRNGSL
ncbi:MAG: autotransporter-associated beta strand repeat-containing protein, partial [Verrucomicrobiaceae bacterium]|nr:autotransporter-associated beta strand repeat-containing protein [Verrucomicrobiaceae bacterium]